MSQFALPATVKIACASTVGSAARNAAKMEAAGWLALVAERRPAGLERPWSAPVMMVGTVNVHAVMMDWIERMPLPRGQQWSFCETRKIANKGAVEKVNACPGTVAVEATKALLPVKTTLTVRATIAVQRLVAALRHSATATAVSRLVSRMRTARVADDSSLFVQMMAFVGPIKMGVAKVMIVVGTIETANKDRPASRGNAKRQAAEVMIVVGTTETVNKGRPASRGNAKGGRRGQ